MRHYGYEAIDVGAHVNLDHVAIGKNDVSLGHQGGEMTDAIVDGDASRKGNTCIYCYFNLALTDDRNL